MINVRRWYIYLICTISLQAVTWAVVDLIDTLFAPNINALRSGHTCRDHRGRPAGLRGPLDLGEPPGGQSGGTWIDAAAFITVCQRRRISGSPCSHAGHILVYWFVGFLHAPITVNRRICQRIGCCRKLSLPCSWQACVISSWVPYNRDASLVPEAGRFRDRPTVCSYWASAGMDYPCVVAITGILRFLFGLLAGRLDLSGVPVTVFVSILLPG